MVDIVMQGVWKYAGSMNGGGASYGRMVSGSGRRLCGRIGGFLGEGVVGQVYRQKHIAS